MTTVLNLNVLSCYKWMYPTNAFYCEAINYHSYLNCKKIVWTQIKLLQFISIWWCSACSSSTPVCLIIVVHSQAIMCCILLHCVGFFSVIVLLYFTPNWFQSLSAKKSTLVTGECITFLWDQHFSNKYFVHNAEFYKCIWKYDNKKPYKYCTVDKIL